MTYYFGVYHWQKHLVPVTVVAAILAIAGIAWWNVDVLPLRVTAVAIATGTGIYGVREVSKLVRPLPWSIKREKYDQLGTELPYESAENALDIGCGTGRSLVGLAPHIPERCDVTGLDRFDDRIILENGPHVAKRNAAQAGLETRIVTGDATTIPFADGTYDVISVCQMLHDLSPETIRQILRETHRVCSPGGTIGLIELPFVNDTDCVSPEFWEEVVTDAGFTIDTVQTYPWKNGEYYVVLTATAESPDER